MKGGEALIMELNRIVYQSGISSPATSRRGMNARLRYLNSAAGRAELKAQGVSERALKSWMKGKATPSRENRERIDGAYWTRRRENLIRSGWLKRHLENNGAGRRMEIYPVDQSRVVEGRSRPNVTERSVTVPRHVWGDLVDAWADQDDGLMDEIWEDIISDLDSDWTAYSYVSSVGIGA
uniref:Transcriptional regulator n=1 Tax=Streptomyces sp. NBC_00093 TaxID=2975649 RepID=A0AAU2AJW7_9ACTN